MPRYSSHELETRTWLILPEIRMLKYKGRVNYQMMVLPGKTNEKDIEYWSHKKQNGEQNSEVITLKEEMRKQGHWPYIRNLSYQSVTTISSKLLFYSKNTSWTQNQQKLKFLKLKTADLPIRQCIRLNWTSYKRLEKVKDEGSSPKKREPSEPQRLPLLGVSPQED